MSKTALICGSSGFIGKHAASAFLEAGWKVSGADRVDASHQAGDTAYFQGDFLDAAFVDSLLQQTRPERIVFVAGPASVEASFADPVEDFRNQALPLIQVLDRVRRTENPPGVLLVSSAAVYGNPAAIPVREEAVCAPISPYGFHKLQQEALLDEFAVLYGLRTCKARIFSTYGSGLRHLAVWDITRRALNGDYTMEGSPGASRDYLHITDAARALERICSAADFRGEAVNVASGMETPLERVAMLVYEALGLSERPSYEGSGGRGKPLRWCADVSRLHSLGALPGVPLEEGLQQTVDWIKAHA